MALFQHLAKQTELLQNREADGLNADASAHANRASHLFEKVHLVALACETYYPAPQVARRLKLSAFAISRFSGMLLITFKPTTSTDDDRFRDTKIDIGLNMQLEKRELYLPGYARRTERGWHYSDAAIDLLELYKLEFAEVFSYFEANKESRSLDAKDIFGVSEVDSKVETLQRWLKKQRTATLPLMPLSVPCCSEPVVKLIELRAQKHHQHASQLAPQVQQITLDVHQAIVEAFVSFLAEAFFFSASRSTVNIAEA